VGGEGERHVPPRHRGTVVPCGAGTEVEAEREGIQPLPPAREPRLEGPLVHRRAARRERREPLPDQVADVPAHRLHHQWRKEGGRRRGEEVRFHPTPRRLGGTLGHRARWLRPVTRYYSSSRTDTAHPGSGAVQFPAIACRTTIWRVTRRPAPGLPLSRPTVHR